MSNFNNNFNNFGMNQCNNNLNMGNVWFNPMNCNTPQNNMNQFLWGFPNNVMPNMQQNFVNFGGNMNQMFNMNQMNNMNKMNMNFNNMNINMNNMNQINNMNMNKNMNNLANSFNNMNNMNMDLNNFGNCFNNMNNMNMNMNNLANSFNNMNNMNMNMNNLANSFNNMSINDNFPLKKFNSEEIQNKMNINNLDSQIQINFRFISSQSFKVNAKQNEKLIDVINRFKNSECPKELKNSLTIVLCHGEKVKDLQKTLFELNIQNNEQILFMDNRTPELEENDQEEFKFTEREKEMIMAIKLEYLKIILIKELLNISKENKDENNNNKNNDNNGEEDDKSNIPSFLDYLRGRDRKIGINVKEHNHLLVYCLTNIDWKCNICNNQYKKDNMRYYCSLCDYSLCEECHYKRKYFMKKSFPKGVKPSNSSVNIHFFETDYHEHRLVFCRSSRHFAYFNGWYCNNCHKSYDNKDWSFYCTSCDYDMCCECGGFH